MKQAFDELSKHGELSAHVGICSNASTKSHAELDEAIELDEGDPKLLATAHDRLNPLLPRLSIVGGCCGTDARHVATLWNVD